MRRLAHGIGAGIDTQHELVRVLAGMGQYETAIAGTQVHRRRGMRRGEIG